ncbi:GTP cyclohydrolase II [Bdellovibrio sp. KM01]|uniref:GTP cyclohydrolase II n=1 Tax=Bdellovibrio sp. KM01 TaxID=2748865 RepID=UPI0015E9D16D|nr:GTP cyclohydrolase II [Bdellovibrio sp. KM01]QLY24352.1 GTP cyclohydrolase II [Bdellovibrio sp. KM01]
MYEPKRSPHVVLTSHSSHVFKESLPIHWGATTPMERGPIIGSLTDTKKRNAIGTHSGSYTVYRALSIAQKRYSTSHRPDLNNTQSPVKIGPFPSWQDPDKIVSLDPWGFDVPMHFKEAYACGYDVRPTIAVTQARLQIPEINEAIDKGRLKIDGKIITEARDIKVTKVAIEPVWYLPGIAKRLGVEEGDLRKILFQETGGMFPELVTRPDLKVMLPPIGSTTVYIFGETADLANPEIELTCRVHDECNGSDVFGSDICTCRPYLIYGIEDAVRTAQRGGVGLIAYYRKEGRALGEVTKFLVYNARKRQAGGDSAATYFHRTECVAGVEDARFQELMPDILNFFGITKIHNLHSMSNMKYDAIVKSGITVVNRISIPDNLIPADAQVEMEAKKAAGYFNPGAQKTAQELAMVQGRGIDEQY